MSLFVVLLQGGKGLETGAYMASVSILRYFQSPIAGIKGVF
jgi:hypothetical protein